jgi:AraC-like DNA-binding protein
MQYPAESVRPEWLFEITNSLQPLVIDIEAHGRHQRVQAVFDAIPPKSLFERGVQVRLVRRLWTDDSITVMPDWEPSGVSTQPRRMESWQQAVDMVKVIVARNVAGPWTVDLLARRVGLNRTDLEAAFRWRESLTIHAFVVLSRVRAAKTMLRDSGWRIEEISKAVGYRSKVSLYKQFRRVEGMTPEEYRQRWMPVSATPALLSLIDRESTR